MALAPVLEQVAIAQSTVTFPGVESYAAPAGYPTTAFSSYWPAPSSQEPQPKLYDPVLNITFPRNLTDPDTLPDHDPDPVYFPQPIEKLPLHQQKQVIHEAVSGIKQIISSAGSSTNNCSMCKTALSKAQHAAQLAPELVPAAMYRLCLSTDYESKDYCQEDTEASAFGQIWTQVLALADVTGLDGDYICNYISSDICDFPTTSPLNINDWFPKPKPADCEQRVPKPSGERVKVLHMSDFHLDPRYKVGAEGNCTNGLCCRSNAENEDIKSGSISVPAPLYGSFDCDTPYDLGLAALQAVGPLTGTSKSDPLAWTIYTGDLVSHETQLELSRLYVEYEEDSIYYMFKQYLHTPVFPVLGNHDTNPEAIDAPHSMPGNLSQQMSWNFEHVSGLWKHNGWIDDAAVAQAKVHYGAYSIKNHYGLRMITFNSDFWYHCKLDLQASHSARYPQLLTFTSQFPELHQHHQPGR